MVGGTSRPVGQGVARTRTMGAPAFGTAVASGAEPLAEPRAGAQAALCHPEGRWCPAPVPPPGLLMSRSAAENNVILHKWPSLGSSCANEAMSP